MLSTATPRAGSGGALGWEEGTPVVCGPPLFSRHSRMLGALQAGLSAEQLQDMLVAIAPIVGTARVMTAAGNLTAALGIAIAVAEAEIEAQG